MGDKILGPASGRWGQGVEEQASALAVGLQGMAWKVRAETEFEMKAEAYSHAFHPTQGQHPGTGLGNALRSAAMSISVPSTWRHA